MGVFRRSNLLLAEHQGAVGNQCSPSLQLKKLNCPFCVKNFNCKQNLKRHMLMHTGIRPFICPSCNKSFTQRSILKTHMLVHQRALLSFNLNT
ncbi:UNVERIFIED_CONTAM: zinc finger and BTB domain-containing protein 10 [Trichonephila clavipes]